MKITRTTKVLKAILRVVCTGYKKARDDKSPCVATCLCDGAVDGGGVWNESALTLPSVRPEYDVTR